MKKLFLVDAYALIYRSYYAFIGRPMRNSAGMNTSAIFGFVKFLNEIVRRESPHYIGVAFDPKGGNFRNKIYPDYKANRSETPEDIIISTPYIKKILDAMRIPCLEIPGYEADDVIGTLSVKAADDGFQVYMVTPDKDFGQLVQPSVYIYKQRKSGEGVEIVDMAGIEEKYGVDDPKLIIDVLALWGDSSDNIPGVPGIGEKGAVKLVCQYGTVENILRHVSEIKGKTGENLASYAQQIAMSKILATIKLDVPVEFDPAKLIMEEPDCDKLREIYMELGFTSLLRTLPPPCGPSDGLSAAPIPVPAKGRDKKPAPDLFSSAPAANAPAPDLFSQSVSADDSAATQADLFSSSPEAGDTCETINTVPHNYYTLVDEADIKAFAARLEASDNFCFDTETAGFDLFNDRLVGLSFALKEFEAYYLPLPENREETLRMLELFRPAFENVKISKTAQNAKFDIMALSVYGIEVKGFLYDTMLIHYLLNPESRHGMDYLARTCLNYSCVSIESLIGKGARQITMDMVPVDKCAEYAAEDADVTLRLKNLLWPILEKQELVKLYSDIEEPLIRVLACMELEGVRIDAASLKLYGEELTGEMHIIEKNIREQVGDPTLNVNSPRQLGEILFGRMKIDPKAKTTSKSKQYRTDEEYLQSIADRHPVINMILEYRGLKKLVSTYIDALPQLINKKTGKIHTSFNQAVTATGRLSSNNPNLQNIPVRDDRGRELRKAFIPSEEGCLLLSVDYSQVELRLMAHLSGDKDMIEAFNEDKDIHSATASRIFSVPEDEVGREQRRQAKVANFGIIYGISAFGLSQRLNIPRTEAKAIIDEYFNAFKGVKKYMEDVVRNARETGYVTTMFGRKRYLPDIKSSNSVVRGLAERNAINAPIQGSAADIIKIAMIHVHEQLRAGGFKSRLILQVHDELVLNLHVEEREQVKRLVLDCMESAAKLRVPLTAEAGIGKNWLEAH